MTTEVQELENEKRGSKRRIKGSRRGRRISERKRGHAGQTAALCDLSDNFEAKVFRGAPTRDHVTYTMSGRLRRDAGQSYIQQSWSN